MGVSSATVTADNTFTLPLETSDARMFDVSVWGTFSGVVTLQRSFDSGATWRDVTTYSGPIEDTGMNARPAMMRAGVKTGQYVSGTIYIELGD